MRKWLLFLVLLLAIRPAAAQLPATANLTTAGTAAGCTVTSTACIYVLLPKATGATGIELSGTWSGTVSFYGAMTASGVTKALSSTDATPVTSATANGAWQFNTAAFTRVLAVFTTATSGTVVVNVTTSTASARSGGGSGGGGNVTSTTMTSGVIPQATGANSIGNSSPQLDDGVSTANVLTYAGTGGITASGGPVSSTGPAGDAGASFWVGNVVNQTIPTNQFGIAGFNSTSAAAYGWQPSTTAPSGGTNVMEIGVPSSGWAQVSYVAAPAGTIVGTTDTQTLTSKTLTAPVLNGTPTGTSLQGTDTLLLTSGTVSGTASPLCTDANGGATTSGCPAASGALLQVPGTTAANTAAPTANGVVSLTLLGTTGTGTPDILDVCTNSAGACGTNYFKINSSGRVTNGANGAASASAQTFTGTTFTGGTGTTTFPFWYYNCGAAPTSWSTNGTVLGINACSGFTGNLVDFHVNGGNFQFAVDNGGNVTAAGQVVANGLRATTVYQIGGANMLISATVPTITAAGCGGSAASIPNGFSTAAFTINVGTAPTSGGCTVTMPTAADGWACFVTDQTTNSTSVFVQKQTSNTTTSVVLKNFSDVAVATAPTASDIWVVSCHAY